MRSYYESFALMQEIEESVQSVQSAGRMEGGRPLTELVLGASRAIRRIALLRPG